MNPLDRIGHILTYCLLCMLCTSCSASSNHKPGIYTQPYPMGDSAVMGEPGIVYFWPQTSLEWKVSFMVAKEQPFLKGNPQATDDAEKIDRPKPGTRPVFYLMVSHDSDAVVVNRISNPQEDYGFFVPTKLMTGSKTHVKELKVSLTDDLRLSSIGGGFDDKRGAVIGNIVKTGLSLLKLLNPYSIKSDPFLPTDEYVKRELLEKHKYTFFRAKPLSEVIGNATISGNYKLANDTISNTDADMKTFALRVAEALKKDKESGVDPAVTLDALSTELSEKLGEFGMEFKYSNTVRKTPENAATLFKELKKKSEYLYPKITEANPSVPGDATSWDSQQYFRGVPYRIPASASIKVSYGAEVLETVIHAFPELGRIGFVDISGEAWVDAAFGATFVSETGALKELAVSKTSRAEKVSGIFADQLSEISTVYEAIKTEKETAETEAKEEKQKAVDQSLAVTAKEEEIASQRVVLNRAISDLAKLQEDRAAIDASNPANAEKVAALDASIDAAADLIANTNNKLRTLEQQLFYLKLGFSVGAA